MFCRFTVPGTCLHLKTQVVAVQFTQRYGKKFGAIADQANENKNLSSWSVVSTLPGDRFRDARRESVRRE